MLNYVYRITQQRALLLLLEVLLKTASACSQRAGQFASKQRQASAEGIVGSSKSSADFVLLEVQRAFGTERRTGVKFVSLALISCSETVLQSLLASASYC